MHPLHVTHSYGTGSLTVAQCSVRIDDSALPHLHGPRDNPLPPTLAFSGTGPTGASGAAAPSARR